MSLEELGAALRELEGTRKTAEAEIAALQSTGERVGDLETDRDALLADMDGRVSEAIDSLTGVERVKLYKMLRLEVEVLPESGFRVAGTFRSRELSRLPGSGDGVRGYPKSPPDRARRDGTGRSPAAARRVRL